MATTLVVGDIAVVHYNTSTDAFSFVFLRDVEAGTIVNFTDNGWLAAGGFRPGEQTVTYTAPTAITAGTIVTLSGLNLDDAGDQIIAYQGDPATPTILHVVDFADGDTTVAGDATNDNTTALPLGFTLGINAVAVGFGQALYAGPINGSAEGLFTALNNSANWLDSDTLPVRFTFDAKPIIDLDADNSTHLGSDYETVVGSGGPAVPVADIDLDIDDFDDFDLTAAEFRIVGFDVRDLLAINGTLPDGIVATAYRAVDGTIRLEGRASHEDYETAIRQVVFSTDDTPGDRKRIKISVFDGQSWSKDANAFVDVLGNLIAAPPGLDLDANNSTGGGADATATFTMGGPATSVTDTDVSITADTSMITSATITILGWSLRPGDELSAGTLPTGITASPYNPFTGIITLSGEASLADYQAALRAVVFDTTSTSTADRGIQMTVTDSSGLISNLATMYMHVVSPPPNVAPVIDLDANNSTTTGANYLTGFTEGGPPVAIADTDILIIDLDDPSLASATITLTNPQAGDVLILDGAPPPGIVVSGSGTTIITITGIAASGSYQTALEQIRFSNDSVDPSNVTRTIEIVVNDGTTNSNTATALVQVEAVNNFAPVIDLDPNDSSFSTRTTFRTLFTENGSPIPIADTDTTITDLDSTTLVSATITLANQLAGDLLTVTLPLPGGIVASAYDPGTGVLTLSGTATLDDYESALRQIRYNNDSDNPDTIDRLIEVVVNDGVNTSNVAAAVIGVVPVNDAPEVVLEGTVYVEGAATVTLDPLASVSDLDDAQLSQVVIRITSGVIPGDGDTLTVGGLTSGTVDGITFVWDAAEHAMLLIGASSVLNYQNLLRTVGFDSSSDNPTDYGAEAVRILTWTVSDGTAVTTTTTTLDIVAVNDAPQATVAAIASYAENAAPLVLSPASTVTDVDNVVLVAGEIRIVSGSVNGDLLTVNGLQSGTFQGIEFSYDPGLRSLTFTHPTLVADYEAFLEAVAFSSTSDNPTNSGLNPTRTLSWFIFDGAALSNLQTTVVSITALEDPPVNTVPGAQTVNEDTALPIAGVSVTDVDGGPLTTTLTVTSGTLNVTAGAGVTGNGTGAVTITGTQAEINTALAGLSYTGNLNFNGADTLTVATDDGTAPPDIDTIAITVNPLNDAPVAQDGSNSGNEDTPISGALVATDVDGPSLSYSLATQAANGTAVVNPDGSYTYTPNLNFNGSDSFTFTASDGTAGSNTATISLTINPLNDAPVNAVPGAQSVNEDMLLPIAGVSVTDVDGGPLTTTLTVTSGTLNVTAGAGVTGNGTGAVTIIGTATEINAALAGLSYTGNLNFNGSDTLTVTTGDGIAQDIDTVAITVNPVNDPPTVPAPKILRVNEDTTLLIPGVAVSDVDSLSLTTVMEVTNGIINVTAGTGATVDGNGTAMITINGTQAEINAALAGLSYTGNLDFNGEDFLFLVTRDEALERGTTMLVIVDPVNDPPVNTVPAAQSVNEDTLLPIAGVSVTDVDGSALTTTLTVTSGTLNVAVGAGVTGNGTATVTITGTAEAINAALAGLSYTGNLNFNGSDTLTVTTIDGTAQDIDTVAITVNPVNDPPSGTDTTVGTAEDVAYVFATADFGFSDLDANSLLAVTITTLPASGTLANNGAAVTPGSSVSAADITAGLLVYTPPLNGAATALASFTFQVQDNGGTANGGIDLDATPNTITIDVTAVNDAPLAQDGSASGNEDTPISGTLVATDVDGPSLSYSLGTQAANGTVVVNTDGTYIYTPNADFNGTDSFTFTASDGIAGSNTATVSLTVNPLNDAPVAQDGSASGNEDTPISGALVATDVDGPSLSYSLGTQAANGTVVVNPDGSYSYTPNADFNGTDSFTFTASDGTAGSNTATISLTVNPLNDAPVAQDGSASGNEDTPISGTLVATDVDAPSLSYSLGTQAANGTAVVNTDSTYTYTPNLNFNGSDSFTFTASDGIAGSNAATVSLTVLAAPTLDLDADDSASGGSDYATTFIEHGAAVRIADTDIAISASALVSATITLTNPLPGDLLSVSGTLPGGVTAVYDPATGVMTLIGAAPAATYQAASDQIVYFNSSDNPSTDARIITVVVNDGINDSNTATAIVNVAPVNDAPEAQDGNASGTEDTAINGALVATDVDSESLTYRLGTQATHGIAVVNPDGSFSYTPAQDFNSTDSFTFLANDGEADSNIAIVNLAIAAVNDAPHLDLDADDSTVPSTHFATTFAGVAVPISDVDVAIADPDSATLASATIHLLIPNSGDLLSVNGSLPAGIGASAYDPVSGVLTLTGATSLADYQTAIHQVEFGTSGASLAARMIEVTVNDGTGDSNAAVTVIDFSSPPEPPPATIDPHWMATRDFTPHPAGWSPIISADLAGDHMSDLLWRSDSTGSLDEWQIVNAGWARSVDLGGYPDAGWVTASTGDFNGDGTDDILWFDPASGNTDIWKMANGEWAGSISPGLHPTGFEVAATGDFDGDGTSDVLWFNSQTGVVDIWKIENGQWAGSVNPGPSPAGFSIAGTGDFDHDGNDDVLWFNPSSGDVKIWEMQNGQLAASVDVGPHPSGYSIVGSAEFTGDGASDILWFNPTTGHVDLWKIQDSHWTGSVDIGLHPLGWEPFAIGDTDGNGIADVWWREGTTTHVEIWVLSIL